MSEYISKHEVIEEIKRIYCTDCNSYNGAMCRACEHMDDMDIIEDIPAADVQPVKHGKWESSQRTIETGTVYCSNCAIEYYISDLQTVGDCNGIVHYCPNCGARMDDDSE